MEEFLGSFDQEKKTNVMAFVVFRSMDGKAMIQEAHNKNWCNRAMTLFCGRTLCKPCCKGRRERLLNKYYYDEWQEMPTSDLPENINWPNLSLSKN